jgi:AraC-like DNA-binding protein
MDDGWQVRLYGAHTARIGSPENPWNMQGLRAPFWRLYRNDGDGPHLLLLPRGEPYPLRAGGVYVIPAGVDFHSRAPREAGHFYVHFDVLGVPPGARRALFGRPLALPYSPLLTGMVDALWGVRWAAHGADPSLRLRLTALLYEALAASVSCFTDAERARWLPASGGDAAAAVRPALEHVAAHLGERLSVPRLAALCCLSEDYFIRRFREGVGATPTQYVREQRVAEAARRLAFTDDSIERIAEETGFGSRHYFTRVFTRHMGRTPAAYRAAPRV